MHGWLPDEQRVVITGIGAISPVGLDMRTAWANVRDGVSGIGPITRFDATEFGVKIAGEATGFDPNHYMDRRVARRTDIVAQFSLAALQEALAQSGLNVTPDNAPDIGVLIGSGAGGIETYLEQKNALDRKGPRGMSPMLIPRIVVDTASVAVSMEIHTQGPNVGVASACSTSLDAIGLSLETIRRGDAQVMITGGTEAAVNVLGIGGFDQLRALSHRNDDPTHASRPFDLDRDGFVLSEGSVVLVVESLAHARRRGATPLAEVRSYAATSDGLHLTAPDETGASASRAISRALVKGRLNPDAIGYVNAHATATPLGDPIELNALRGAFHGHTERLMVSSTKSTTGHMLGAAGAMAVAITTYALLEGVLPPTTNLDHLDPQCEGVDHIANVARKAQPDFALVQGFGFGGHNSAIVIARWTE